MSMGLCPTRASRAREPRYDPSFFFTKTTEELQGETDSLIIPFLSVHLTVNLFLNIRIYSIRPFPNKHSITSINDMLYKGCSTQLIPRIRNKRQPLLRTTAFMNF